MTVNHWIFGLCTLFLGVAVVFGTADFRLPGNNRGYEPEQPIAFSHRLHAGEMEMDCQYCHFGARQSRHAGVPPASVCMNCHTHVSTNFPEAMSERTAALEEKRDARRIVSPEINKIYRALGLDENLERLTDGGPEPIAWVRVHNLPDFVYFDHRPHVARKIACETCHGPVHSMERLRQQESLSMGWCIECHRSNEISPVMGGSGSDLSIGGERADDHVSTNCVTCHL